MSILVVGATGTLGRQIVRRALDEGHSVRCMVRSYSKAAFLKEWGAELVGGDLCDPATLAPSFADGTITAVIDAATARATDSLGVRQVDWEGKVNLIQAAKSAGVDRYVFFSILSADRYPTVPLMSAKHCIELYLAQLGLRYTVLRPCGFLQGTIGQFAIPILENQLVWVPDRNSPAAYINSQDAALFAVRALAVPETEKRAFPLLGPRAWSADEIVRLCERLSGRSAKVARIPLGVLRAARAVARCFAWSQNAADRLAFAEILAAGDPLNVPMEETYAVFGLEATATTSLEGYLEEYFARILKKLRELDYDKTISAQQSKRKKTLRF